MTTMGITTAMAMVPAGDNPLELLVDDFPCPLRAALDVDDADEAVPEIREEASVATGVEGGVLITVTTTVEGGISEPLDVLARTMDVTSWVDAGTDEAVTTEVTGARVVVGVVGSWAVVWAVVIGVVGAFVVVNGVVGVKGAVEVTEVIFSNWQ